MDEYFNASNSNREKCKVRFMKSGISWLIECLLIPPGKTKLNIFIFGSVQSSRPNGLTLNDVRD
jgi:hypothetical protein